MSKEYRTIRIPEGVFAELEGVKREGETWEGLMRRLLDGRELEEIAEQLKEGMDILTVEEAKELAEEETEMIEKMAERLPEKTADELEGRMR